MSTHHAKKAPDEPVALPRNLGYTLTGNGSNEPVGPKALDIGTIKACSEQTMSPATLLEKVQEHLLGSAEYSTFELGEIARRSVSAYRKIEYRLHTITDRENNDE